MKDYRRHIILLTDRLLQNYMKIIRQRKDKNIATTHIVGIGSTTNFDMSRYLAIEGGGEYLFIKNFK